MTTLKPKISSGPSVRRPPPKQNSFRALESPSLAHAVQEATRAFPESTLKPIAPPGCGLGFQPRIILALLSYCYAREIYGSASIGQVLRRDSKFCALCHNDFPDAKAIREFRHDNRQTVQFCLEAVLRSLVEQEPHPGKGAKLNKSQLAQEASRRIVIATFIDSMELEREQNPKPPFEAIYLFAIGKGQRH